MRAQFYVGRLWTYAPFRYYNPSVLTQLRGSSGMEDFTDRVVAAYGDGYDVGLIKFSGDTKSMLWVTCPEHGEFTISHDNFIYMAGCPRCRDRYERGRPIKAKRRRGGSRRRPGRVPARHGFYIHEVSGGFLKIGITSGSVEARRVQIENASDFEHTVIYVKYFYDRALCASVEKAIKRAFKMRVAPVGSMRDGLTETLALHHLESVKEIVASFPVLRK